MAISYIELKPVQFSRGESALAMSGYGSRKQMFSARTGKTYDFSDREQPVHSAVFVPEGAPAEYSDAETLWNAAESAERRKDAQPAWRGVAALPANREMTLEDHINLTHSFVDKHWVKKGLAVQLDIHAPDEAEGYAADDEDASDDEDDEKANWHAHLLITTRRLSESGFAAKKARDLAPQVRQFGGRGQVVSATSWKDLWTEHQNDYFRAQGLPIRVDADGIVPQPHYGVKRIRGEGAAGIAARRQLDRQANAEAASQPDQVLEQLTYWNSTFTTDDIDWLLSSQFGQDAPGREAFAQARHAVLNSPELLALHDPATGEAADRFTTREVRKQERNAATIGNLLANRSGGAIARRAAVEALANRTLRSDQANAFRHATDAGHLKLITGRAGTGKSHTLAAIREAHELSGRRVVGLAFTHEVAQDMAANGFKGARTAHSMLKLLHKGKVRWDRNTVVMVDEAAMVDTPVMYGLLDAANRSGAKLILAGDDRQLSSIQRGGLFAQLAQQHGAAEIKKVVRQTGWQRQAARDLAEYRFGDALQAFEREKAIQWRDSRDEARGALVEQWAQDRAALIGRWRKEGGARPLETQFVFAYTNDEVDTLNVELRQAYRAQETLDGPEWRLKTVRGHPKAAGGEQVRYADFARGDRIQFTQTRKSVSPSSASIYNGNLATITALDEVTGEIEARLDGAGGRLVRWDPKTFQGFRHGYAGTIHKGQGKTIDHTYLYHSQHMSSAPSYVALTRQRKSAKLYVARETACDVDALAKQMGRHETRAASLAWVTEEELARGRGRAPVIDPAKAARWAQKRKRDDEERPEVVAGSVQRRRLHPPTGLEADDSSRFAERPPEPTSVSGEPTPRAALGKRKRAIQEPAELVRPSLKRVRVHPSARPAGPIEPVRAKPLVRMTVERERAIQRSRARRDKQRAEVARQKLRWDLIQRWGGLYLAYQQASQQWAWGVSHQPAYDEARDKLLAFGAGLAQWPGQIEALRSDAAALKQQIRLHLMAHSDNPSRVAANIVAIHEKRQRARLRPHLHTRTRQRSPHRE